MKPIDPLLIQQFSSLNFIPALLIWMEVAGREFFFTSWSRSIYYLNSLYLSRGMNLNNIPASTSTISNKTTIDFDDTDRALYSVFGDYDAGEYPVEITIISIVEEAVDEVTRKAIEERNGVLAVFNAFDGLVDNWSYQPGIIKITFADLFAQWARVTMSEFSTSCRWVVFKGLRCKYLGAATECNRTFTECATYGNEKNFGGFRWVASMINKKLEV